MSAQITLSNTEKIGLLGNLSTLLSAGIPVLEAVDSILEDTKGHQRKVLETLKADLLQGKRVYSSFARYPRLFDRVTINLIKASEEAGTLETTLKDIQEHIQKEIEFSDKVKFAMIYPTLILLLFTGVLLMILIVVIPKIASVFSRLKVQLPLPTRILIFASDILLKQTLYLVGGVVVISGLLIFLYKRNRQTIMTFIFGFPLISGLVKQIDFTRFSRSMYLLLSSGLPITTALELSGEVVLRRDTAKLIAKCKDMIVGGKRMADGLRTQKGLVPTIMIKLTEAGEKSGTLDKSMSDISKYLDYQVTNTLKTITAVIEPALLVFVGISVGAMMLAIIAPIYGLIGQVSSR